jgi:L-ascorbate metabolism protein UlaG (beta-lactamase superfamily)
MTADCQSKINKFDILIKMDIVEPFQELDLGKIKISTFPAYNKDKNFHAKNENFIGYLIKISDAIIYHAGDSDFIPEMQKLTGYNHKNINFIALLPIGGKFTMNVDEAVEVAKLLKPNLVVPMHWGSIVGSKEDAEEFVQICSENGIDAKILEKE